MILFIIIHHREENSLASTEMTCKIFSLDVFPCMKMGQFLIFFSKSFLCFNVEILRIIYRIPALSARVDFFLAGE